MGEPLPQQAGAGSGEQVLPDPQSSLLRQPLVEMVEEKVVDGEMEGVVVVEEIRPVNIFTLHLISDFSS